MHALEGPVRLARRQLARLEGGAGQVIRVTEGALWITQDGDYADHIVEAGQLFRVRTSGLTLLSALAPSAYEVAQQPAGLRLASVAA